VADERIGNTGAGDDVARLVALTERQHELWDLLRGTKDEQQRNVLLDELTANRAELSRLKGRVSSELDRPRTAPQVVTPPQTGDDEPKWLGEQLRSRILGPPPDAVAPPQPPPPPPPPPISLRPEQDLPPVVEPASFEVEPASRGVEPAPAAPPMVETHRPPADAVAPPAGGNHGEQDIDEPGLLLPEKFPYRSREDDLAASRARRGVPEQQPDSAPVPDEVAEPISQPEAAETATPIGIRERQRQLGHEAYRDLERMRPHAPTTPSRLLPVLGVLVALAAIGAAVWFLFFYNSGGEGAPGTSASTSIATEATATPVAAQIQAVVDGLGLGDVVVTESDGTIYLTGTVGTEADRSAIVGAAGALAGDIPVDGTGMAVAVLDDDLRVAALDAITAAGFDKVNVTVSGGVATLTGVTPEAGSADLVDVVRGVDGIAQVVDLTEPTDRAAALAAELDRITAVTPIVFESGQAGLNALQERILDGAADTILSYDGPIVTLVGYTDSAGTTEENVQISLARAEAVRDYLVDRGVPIDRLSVDARGEAGSTGAQSVAGLERRVEFEVGYAVQPAATASFRIGIVAPSARDDLAFTQSIVDAAQVIASERADVGIDISDGVLVTADAEAAIRKYAAEGYDLVIAHGSQYGPSLAAIAPEFPNVAFAWGTAADTFDLPNVSAYAVAADEGGYVMGTIAARLTKSGVIGVVGPLEVGDAAQYINGFTAGVVATNPQVSVLTTYIGSFSDLGLAAEAAAGQVDAGADVLTGSAQMVVGAVGVASENDALWFGNQANQTELAPDLVVASQVYHWEVALRQIISGLDSGVLGGETYTLTLANGGIVIEYNPDYPMPPDVAAEADTVTTGLIDGSVVTGAG
jgi:basic membrane protein A